MDKNISAEIYIDQNFAAREVLILRGNISVNAVTRTTYGTFQKS